MRNGQNSGRPFVLLAAFAALALAALGLGVWGSSLEVAQPPGAQRPRLQ